MPLFGVPKFAKTGVQFDAALGAAGNSRLSTRAPSVLHGGSMPGFCVNCGAPLMGAFCNRCGAKAVPPSPPAPAQADKPMAFQPTVQPFPTDAQAPFQPV